MQIRLAFTAATTLACALLAGAVQAQGKPALKPLDDSELSGVWGQALLDLVNTSQGAYDFSRITLNADITMSTTLTGLKLGTQASGTSDIDISTLRLGRSDLDVAHRTVGITNPYFEWAYSGSTATGDRHVVGMRVGFGGIAGDVGLMMSTVSGSLAIHTASGLATSNGAQSTSLTLGNCTSNCSLALNQVGGVTAGTSDGASRDFFLSILKSALTYPTTNTALGAPASSQAGFWLNWTDRLNALNTTGLVPPNVPKSGP
jgi:hypothetical protein